MIAPLPPPGCKVYTPHSLADALVHRLFDNAACEWLEPSVGRGAFVQALSRRGVPPGRITAVDLDLVPGPVDENANVIRGVDFLEWATTHTTKYDRIIANPPYVAIPKLAPRLKRPAIAALRQLTTAPTAAANYWAAFLIVSMRLLRREGQLGFVLPAAWEYADYSAPIREEILRNFSTVTVHRCHKPLFPEVQERRHLSCWSPAVMEPNALGLYGATMPSGPTLIAGLMSEGDQLPTNPQLQPVNPVTKPSWWLLANCSTSSLAVSREIRATSCFTESRRRQLRLPERVCTPRTHESQPTRPFVCIASRLDEA